MQQLRFGELFLNVPHWVCFGEQGAFLRLQTGAVSLGLQFFTENTVQGSLIDGVGRFSQVLPEGFVHYSLITSAGHIRPLTELLQDIIIGYPMDLGSARDVHKSSEVKNEG